MYYVTSNANFAHIPSSCTPQNAYYYLLTFITYNQFSRDSDGPKSLKFHFYKGGWVTPPTCPPHLNGFLSVIRGVKCLLTNVNNKMFFFEGFPYSLNVKNWKIRYSHVFIQEMSGDSDILHKYNLKNNYSAQQGTP